MRLLLDTHIFLWYLTASRKLAKSVFKQIETADVVFISAAAIWDGWHKNQARQIAQQHQRPDYRNCFQRLHRIANDRNA